MASYLAEEYKEKVAPALEEKFNYTGSKGTSQDYTQGNQVKINRTFL